MELDLWLDLVCPWCYVGERRLHAALARFPARDHVTVRFRSFQLDPTAPRRSARPLAEVLAGRYGGTVADAHARHAQLAELGRADGIEFRFDDARHGNTFDAHRLVHLAAEHGLQRATVERLMRGYFSEGLPIGHPAALAAAVADVGLDGDAVAATLAGDRHADAVREDERRAAAIGARGVPFLVLDGRYAVSGAYPIDAYLTALERAWGDRPLPG